MFQLPESSTFAQDHWEPDYNLPNKYGETFIVLMIRDPQNIFAYWEVAENKVNEIVAEYGEDNLKGSNLAVRLSWPDHKEIIIVNDHTESWYISVADWGIPLFGELGRILADNTFITLAVSNRLHSYLSFNLLSKKNLGNNTLQETLDKWQPGVSS